MILYIIYYILYITGENRERMHNNNPPTDILWPWHESRGNTTSTGSFEGANLRLLCLGQEWAQKWGCNYSFKFVINIITIYHKYMHIIIHICIYVYNNLISYKSIINYNYMIIYIYTYIYNYIIYMYNYIYINWIIYIYILYTHHPYWSSS